MLVSATVCLAYLEGLRIWAAASWKLEETLERGLFVAGVLAFAVWVGDVDVTRKVLRVWWRHGALLALTAGAGVLYATTTYRVAAGAVSATFYALLVVLSTACRSCRRGVRWVSWFSLAAAGGIVPVAVGQIESAFAEEEFFAAVQALALGVWTVLLMLGNVWIATGLDRTPETSQDHKPGISVPIWLAYGVAAVAFATGVVVTIRSYQRSFYPMEAPDYVGVSRQEPYLCGEGSPDPTLPSGEETFQRLLDRVAANPDAGTPEYGMLAVATGERRWAEAYRVALLDDAWHARYTEPAHSVKYGQNLAARRAYYFARVKGAFPGLFSSTDEELVRAWLAAVNRRALTLEWVDWMYALAFGYWPRGPYENQENGAGLLALLETYDLVDAELSVHNRQYLADNRRGWYKRFRNTDDAYIYQMDWTNNALLQSEYWDDGSQRDSRVVQNQRLGFEWLLLQALPDGAPLRYNLPVDVSLAQTAYLGATLTGDPRYIWWSARQLDWAEGAGAYLRDQPGVVQALATRGVSPHVGSCLMFGDSGLPTQQGPLAPDKIVFRDGWLPESPYLLLNLRFTGWHRYKATNTVTLVYQRERLAFESDTREPFAWLPAGRSVFRDKRTPRESLNGLLVSKTGMAQVLYSLTGLGGPWAQDPPHYAHVARFETGTEVDWALTRLVEWRGWEHDRWIYFFHGGGPIVVVDEAEGPLGAQAAVTWHLSGLKRSEEWRFRLRDKGETVAAAEALFVPVGIKGQLDVIEGGPDGTEQHVLYYGPLKDRLHLVTVFLLGPWVGADAGIGGGGNFVWVEGQPGRVEVPLNGEG